MALRLLGGLDELPAVLDRVGGRHLRGRVLARLHGGDADRHVPFPGRRGVDDVDVGAFTETLKIQIALEIGIRLGAAGLLAPLLDARRFFLDDVADRLDLDAVDLEEVPDVGGTHAAHTDKRYPDGVDRRHLEIDQRGGAGGLKPGGKPAGRARQARFGEGGADAGGGSDLEEIPAVESVGMRVLHFASLDTD